MPIASCSGQVVIKNRGGFASPKTVHQLCSLQLDCTGCPQSPGRSSSRSASFVTPTTHASSQHGSVSNGSTARSTALLQTTCCEAWHACGAAAPNQPPTPRPRRLTSELFDNTHDVCTHADDYHWRCCRHSAGQSASGTRLALHHARTDLCSHIRHARRRVWQEDGIGAAVRPHLLHRRQC